MSNSNIVNSPKLEIEIIDDINQGKKIWEKLSPKNSLYDEWDFRFCFYKQKAFPIKFFVGKYKNEIVGLLPLQLNTEKNYLEFFSEDDTDENKIFIRSGFENYIPQFYKAVNEKAFFHNLKGDNDFIKQQQVDHYIYTLSLDKDIKNYTDFIKKFFNGSGKHRRKIERELRKISENNIEIIKNNFRDIEIFFKYKIKHFGADTCFNDPIERQNLIDLLKLKYDFYMFTYVINRTKVGISLSVLFKKKYMLLQSASDQELFPSIVKYIFMNNIDEAIRLNAKVFDMSRGGENWKERWNFEKIPQYSFKNYKE